MRFKKILAGLLAGVMAVSAVNTAAFAESVEIRQDMKMDAGKVFAVDGIRYSCLADGTLEVQGVNGILVHEYRTGNGWKKEYKVTDGAPSNVKSIKIPAKVKNKKVTGIAKYAFDNMIPIEKIVLPNTLKYIGDQAFRFLPNLKTIDIPNSVETIGKRPFAYCDSLTAINVAVVCHAKRKKMTSKTQKTSRRK